MGKTVEILTSNFPKAVKIELPNKTIKFFMAKVFRQDFHFHFFSINNIEHRLVILPANDPLIILILFIK